MSDTVAELSLDAGGSWLLTTESGSRYVLDLDAMTVLRLARDEPLIDQLVKDLIISRPMRRDGETLALLDIIDPPIKVGDRAVLVVGGLDSNNPNYLNTTRTTTPVTEIRRLRSERS